MGSGLFYWSWIRKPTVIEPSLLLEQVEQHSTIAVAIHVGPTCQLGWGLIKVGFKYDNKSWVMCYNLSNAVFLHLREKACHFYIYSFPFFWILELLLPLIKQLSCFFQTLPLSFNRLLVTKRRNCISIEAYGSNNHCVLASWEKPWIMWQLSIHLVIGGHWLVKYVDCFTFHI
jgi:hypothetical protein